MTSSGLCGSARFDAGHTELESGQRSRLTAMELR